MKIDFRIGEGEAIRKQYADLFVSVHQIIWEDHPTRFRTAVAEAVRERRMAAYRKINWKEEGF